MPRSAPPVSCASLPRSMEASLAAWGGEHRERQTRACPMTLTGRHWRAGTTPGGRSANVNGRAASPTPLHRHRDQACKGCQPTPLRGDLMRPRRDENRIKECQLDLFTDHIPAATMRAIRLRRRFVSMAHALPCTPRRLDLVHTHVGSDAASQPCASPLRQPIRGNMSSKPPTPCSETPAPDTTWAPQVAVPRNQAGNPVSATRNIRISVDLRPDKIADIVFTGALQARR